MICPNCKNEIDNDSIFCRFCGIEFSDETEPVIEVQQHISDEPEAPKRVETIRISEPATENPPPKNKKTLTVQLLIALAVILVLGSVLVFAISSSDFSFFGTEAVTDAAGEKVRPGIGTTEITIEETDGTMRTITTDRKLVTAEKILAEYTEVMNNLKADAPAFTLTRYQKLPTEHQNLGALADFILPIIEKYVTSKSATEAVSYTAGNAEKLPLPDSQYGCLLTDTKAIKNAYCEVLEDGNYKLVITLNDELNPPVLSADATSSASITNSVFDTYDALNQITSISELALNKIDFNYTDCTAELVYNPDTYEVETLNMTMHIDITADTLLMEIKARIIDTSEFSGFAY